MPRDPIIALADAIEGLSIENIADGGAKRIAKAIDARFTTGAAPQASGKLRRSIVVDGASDGILVRSQLPYAEAHADEFLPSKPEIQVREAYKAELGRLPKW